MEETLVDITDNDKTPTRRYCMSRTAYFNLFYSEGTLEMFFRSLGSPAKNNDTYSLRYISKITQLYNVFNIRKKRVYLRPFCFVQKKNIYIQ